MPKKQKLTPEQERASKELTEVYFKGVKCEVTVRERGGKHHYTLKVKPNAGYTTRHRAFLGGAAICKILQKGMGGDAKEEVSITMMDGSVRAAVEKVH